MKTTVVLIQRYCLQTRKSAQICVRISFSLEERCHSLLCREVGDSTDDPFTLDPFAPPEPCRRQRHTKLMAHFTAFVGAASEVCGGGGRGRGEWGRGGERRGRGRGGRRGGGRRGGLHHHQRQGVRDGCLEWRWREQGRGIRLKRGVGRTNYR